MDRAKLEKMTKQQLINLAATVDEDGDDDGSYDDDSRDLRERLAFELLRRGAAPRAIPDDADVLVAYIMGAADDPAPVEA